MVVVVLSLHSAVIIFMIDCVNIIIISNSKIDDRGCNIK